MSGYGREQYIAYITMLAGLLDYLTPSELRDHRNFAKEWKARLDREELEATE